MTQPDFQQCCAKCFALDSAQQLIVFVAADTVFSGHKGELIAFIDWGIKQSHKLTYLTGDCLNIIVGG